MRVRETSMNGTQYAIAVVISLAFTGPSFAQDGEVAKIKDANQAFYTALNARDVKAMEGVWAHKPYVVNIGPRSKVVAVGYDEAVAKYWAAAFTLFSKMSVALTSVAQIQTDGKLAWVSGTEEATLQLAAGGDPLKFSTFVTNILEKDGDRWLLISHHAQVIPQ